MRHFYLLLLASLLLIPLLYGENADERVVLDPLPGRYTDPITLQLHTATPLYFTLDGSLPTKNTATRYSRPLPLPDSQATILRYRTEQPDGTLGQTVTATYLVGLDATLPILSLVTDPANLWDTETGIYTNFEGRGRDWERPVTVTFFDTPHPTAHTPHPTFTAPAGLRIHGATSRLYDKKSFRLYFRDEYGLEILTYPLFPDSNVTVFKRLVLHAGGQDTSQLPTNWSLIRQPLVDGLAREMGLIAPHDRPVLLLLNGEAWGIYLIRERLDATFLADHYAIPSAEFLEQPRLNPDFPACSDCPHNLYPHTPTWDNFFTTLTTLDLTNPSDYAYVQSQINLASFTDYAILNSYAVNTDWPHANTTQFRPNTQGGQWQWLVWDSDHTFNFYPGSEPTTPFLTILSQPDSLQGQSYHAYLLYRLLENPAYAEQFYARANALLETTLSSANVTRQIDQLAVQLAPDIDFERDRWPAGTDSWQNHIEQLRTFAQQRPACFRQDLEALCETYCVGRVP